MKEKFLDKIIDVWDDFVDFNEGMAECFTGAYLLMLMYGTVLTVILILLYEFVIK